MILLVAIDECHQSQVGHWDQFRPNMMKVIGRLRIFRTSGAPSLAMSATATSEEVTATISNLGFRNTPILLHASPTQQNIKLVKLKRPPNNMGADGYTNKIGVKLPGFLALLERIYLIEFIKSIQEGRDVKKGIIFCR